MESWCSPKAYVFEGDALKPEVLLGYGECVYTGMKSTGSPPPIVTMLELIKMKEQMYKILNSLEDAKNSIIIKLDEFSKEMPEAMALYLKGELRIAPITPAQLNLLFQQQP